MATKKETTGLTRAQKTTATKALIKELLAIKPMRHNELIDEVAKAYTLRHEGVDTENPNDVKGRVGSVLDIMKKESEIMYDGGMYALKARLSMPAPKEKTEEKPAETPKKRTRAKKAETPAEEKPVEVVSAEESAPAKAEKATPKKRTRAKKAEPTEAPAPVLEKSEEKPAPKKRGRKPKTEAKVEPSAEEKPAEEKPVEKTPAEEKKEEKASVPAPVETPVKEEVPVVPEKTEEKKELIVPPKAEVAQKSVVMDMSFLFGDKALKAAQKPVQTVKTEEKKTPTPAIKTESSKPEQKTAEKPAPTPVKTENKPAKAPVKAESKAPAKRSQTTARKAVEKPLTAEEKLRESFLKRMRALGGDYFEYYSVYLLERYCMKNGRRLEGLRISGGDHDGGIDGEIELTDKFGFKETIYIQSKNWDPEKGKEENWVVGETLLQQFIGACACRQAKDGKQHTRGIFITTSRFTPDAKRILESMSDKIVGYDGNDLYEAAKECAFGIVKKNGEWALDEHLLSGTKAFFQML